MQPLWAPWRMELFVRPSVDDCIFCRFPAQEGEAADRENLILARTPHSFAILNRYPYNNGHLMVIPRRHTSDFARLEDPELDDLHRLLRRAVRVVEEVYRPGGMNLGMNLGDVAGAGIAEHLHYHLVPRWGGDTNFMPVIAETKVLPEHLAQSWEKLREGFARIP